MTQPLQIAIFLYIVAFIVGFYLIYLWLSKTFTSKYENEIETLASQNAETLQQLTHAREKNYHIHEQYEKVHQELAEKEATHVKLDDKQASLMENITALENEKQELQQKIKEEESEILKVRSRIEQLSNELKEINTIQARLDENSEIVAALEKKLAEHKALTDAYLQEIEKLKSLRKSFREEAKIIEDKIFDIKATLKDTGDKIKTIESKFTPEISKLEAESEALKIKALNYKFALKEYLEHYGTHPVRIQNTLIQKLFKTPQNKAEEIASLIDKNEAVRMADKVIQKLFKKNLPKEEH